MVNIFFLCGPYVFCCSYSLLPLQCEIRRGQYVNKGVSVTAQLYLQKLKWVRSIGCGMLIAAVSQKLWLKISHGASLSLVLETENDSCWFGVQWPRIFLALTLILAISCRIRALLAKPQDLHLSPGVQGCKSDWRWERWGESLFLLWSHKPSQLLVT